MNVYTAEGEYTAPKFAAAFARGCGGKVTNEYTPGAWAGFGSPQTWHELQRSIADGHDFYYGDHGYWGRRRYYRITKNAYQHTGQGIPDLRRLARFHPRPLPFHKSGGAVIVCPQSQNHLDRFGVSNWLNETLDIIHRHTDRDVIVRHKLDTKTPLVNMLPRAWAVVCHSSNAAVEALMHGVPVFVTAPCAAFSMGKTQLDEIEYPHYPDGRLEWAGVLAANQWSMEEIAKGIAWRGLQS